MRAFIIGAGSIEEFSFYRSIKINEDDLVICADGGYDHAIILGITPNVVIGDLDSISQTIPSGIEKHTFPSEKNETDMQLAIDYALEKGANEIILLAALGGRVDHSLSNIFLLKYIHNKGAEGLIVNKRNRISFCTDSKTINKMNGNYVSLIPLTEKVTGVTTNGLKYSLTKATLYQADSLGISNEFTEKIARVSIEEGELLIVCDN